jgi:cytidylate kinase
VKGDATAGGTGLRVAIDGPAGTGKSSVAARAAAALGLPVLDTGAIYRTLALWAEREGVSWEDEAALAGLAARMPLRFAGGIGEAPLRVFLGEEDVSAAIRTPGAAGGASRVSGHPAVRAALLPLQRRLSAGGVVAEGRDIGTVVLPDAEVKVFLTASPRVRAERRFAELRGRGVETTLERVLAEQTARDERDRSRAASPMRAADDAVTIDTDGVGLDEVVAKVLAAAARARGGEPGGITL